MVLMVDMEVIADMGAMEEDMGAMEEAMVVTLWLGIMIAIVEEATMAVELLEPFV